MKTILIVDDNFDFFNRMKDAVTKEDIDLIHSTNSRQGLATLSDSNKVDLILIHTLSPQTDTSSFISLKPHETLKTFSLGNSDYIDTYCSEDQFISFIKEKI